MDRRRLRRVDNRRRLRTDGRLCLLYELGDTERVKYTHKVRTAMVRVK